MKPAMKAFLGCVVEVAGGVGLLQEATLLQDRDAVTHRHGLDLVVGDVEGRGAETGLQRGDVGPRLNAQLGVEVRQRLVHQEHAGATHDGATHGDALALSTGQGLRLALEVLGEVEQAGGLADLLVTLVLRHTGELEGEAHVLGHRHVRVEGVVLEDHGDVAVLRGPSSRRRVPPMKMAPWSTSSRPASMRSAVDLPEPDGPTRTMNSPSAMSRFSLLTDGTGLPG